MSDPSNEGRMVPGQKRIKKNRLFTFVLNVHLLKMGIEQKILFTKVLSLLPKKMNWDDFFYKSYVPIVLLQEPITLCYCFTTLL